MASKHVRSGRPPGRKVMHIITGLGAGGAEKVLYRLLVHQDRTRWPSVVISLTDRGELGDQIEALGVPVLAVDMQPGRFSISGYRRLVHILREHRPDVVQTWMYHANLVGGLAARLVGVRRVVWGLRHSTLDPAVDKRSTIAVARLGAWTSRWIPRFIVCCSQATYDSHLAAGYDHERMVLIPNGYDLIRFQPASQAPERLREALGLHPGRRLIGMAARHHPQKDHVTLLKAAAMLFQTRPDVDLALCGSGMDASNEALMADIAAMDVGDRVHLMGEMRDMPAFFGGLDLSTLSSSHGEGFPNVIAESMACATPVVATAVGDSAEIIGEEGWIVPPSDPEALAGAWLEALALSPEEREKLGFKARTRIRERFSIQSMVARYEELYLQAD